MFSNTCHVEHVITLTSIPLSVLGGQAQFIGVVLPALVHVSRDVDNPRVQIMALDSIGQFVKGTDEEVLEPYMGDLLMCLGSLLASEHYSVLESTVRAIAATATSTKRAWKAAYVIPLFCTSWGESVLVAVIVSAENGSASSH